MTKAERLYQAAVSENGCIVCHLDLHEHSLCEIHHRLSGGRRMGEMFVLGLCPTHHRSGLCNQFVVSRDHNQRRFEERYGTEEWLQAQQDRMIEANRRKSA